MSNSLKQQNEDEPLRLTKKFFVSDNNISRDDPVQLQLVYVQVRDSVVSSHQVVPYLSLPLPSPAPLLIFLHLPLIEIMYDDALQLAALQCQIEHGDYKPQVHKPNTLRYSLLFLILLFPLPSSLFPPSLLSSLFYLIALLVCIFLGASD
jgi:hypothetical protein